MSIKKSKLQEIRDTTVVAIKSLLTAHTYDNFDVTDCGSTPVIWPSSDDQDFDTYTLDRVYVNGEQVLVDSSSSWSNRTDRIEELPTDTIIEILDFLENNEELIWKADEDADKEFVFTVNNTGKKVVFSPGNLFWDGSKFDFEKHQYDFPASWNENHVGHFFWSKDVAKAVAPKYNDQKRRETDNFFAADGSAIQEYTVLSKEEWMYLFEHALVKNTSSKNNITIDGKGCLILKPDGFTGTVKDSYTVKEWTKAEKSGLVALPFTGDRYGTSFRYVGSDGNYWSSTPYHSYRAWYANFYSDDAYTFSDYRTYGVAVRLVKVL